MRKLLNKIITSLSTFVLLAVPLLAPATVRAEDAKTIRYSCSGANLSVSGNCDDGVSEAGKLNSILTLVINIFSIVVGFVSVVMIIVGGLKYIMSGGESSNISGAKNTILYAIIGLVVVALAQIIVRFVLTRVSTG